MQASTLTVLIVEDNPDDLTFMLRVLKKNYPDVVVEITRTVTQTLDYLFKTGEYTSRPPYDSPDLILLDLGLPDSSSGLEILRVLKAYSRTQTIPVVAFTASDQDINVLKSYQMGVNSYVNKALDMADYSKAIERILFYWFEVNRRLPAQSAIEAPESANTTSLEPDTLSAPREDESAA